MLLKLVKPELHTDQCFDALRPLLKHRSARLHRARRVAAVPLAVAAVPLAVATPHPKVAPRGPGAPMPQAEASSGPPHPKAFCPSRRLARLLR